MKRVMKLAVMAAITGLMGTGCATTSLTTSSEAAPITYRIGNGDAQYASLRTPEPSTRPRLTPRSHTDASRPLAIGPRGSQGRRFDPSRVDRKLYSHQLVGQRYTVMGQSYTPRHEPNYDVTGQASWYGPGFHGKPTATGETFDSQAITAAHKTLPLNSMLIVTNLENGRSLTVRLNDRGPFIGDRIIDLSEAAAEALGFKDQGVANVRVQYAGPADPMAAGPRATPTAPRVAELPRENVIPGPAPAPVPQRAAPYDPCNELSASYVRPASCLTRPPVRQDYADPVYPDPIAPTAPQRTPEADLPGGGNVTLTIKGPVHIARSDDGTPTPRFIRERLEIEQGMSR